MTPAHPGDRSGVVIVGSVTADVTTFSQRLPARGETILGDEFTLMLGGKGANQAVAAGRSGARTSFVGCVGDDLFHDLVVDGLTAAGVALAHLRPGDRLGVGDRLQPPASTSRTCARYPAPPASRTSASTPPHRTTSSWCHSRTPP